MVTLETDIEQCSHYDKDPFHTVSKNGKAPHMSSANTANAGDDIDKGASGLHASPWDWITSLGFNEVLTR